MLFLINKKITGLTLVESADILYLLLNTRPVAQGEFKTKLGESFTADFRGKHDDSISFA